MMNSPALSAEMLPMIRKEALRQNKQNFLRSTAFKHVLAPSVGIFIVMLSVYTYTLAPTVLWGDPTKLIRFVHSGHYNFLGGGAHGLHTLLGIFVSDLLPDTWPLAYKINFMSALLASLSLSLVYCIFYYFVRSSIPALGATGCIGLSHMFWFVSTIAETYSLLALTFIMSLGAFIIWYHRKSDWLLLLLAASLIIGFLNHYLTLLFIPVYAFFVWYFSNNRARILAIYTFAASAGLAYLLSSSGAAVFREFLSTTYVHLTRYSDYGKLPKELCLFPVYLTYQYPIAVFIGVIGLKSAKNKLVPVFWAIMLAVVFFASFFGKARQLYQLIPAFILFGYFIAVGIKAVTANLNRKQSVILVATVILLQPLTYFIVTHTASHVWDINLVSKSTFQYRDPNIYYLWPNKRNNTRTYDFAKKALSVMDRGGLILADFNITEPLKYLRDIEGFRKDIRIKCTNEFSYQSIDTIWHELSKYLDDELMNGKAVYLAAYESVHFFTIAKDTVDFRSYLNKAYHINRVGDIYHIAGKKGNRARNEDRNADDRYLKAN